MKSVKLNFRLLKSRKQQGVAIIMVLLIVAIATSVAAYMALQQSLWLRQVESQFERAQARQLGLAGIDWARAVLAEDKRGNNVDHGKEIWNLVLPPIPVENGEVIGLIEDRQGLFNLNNVNDMAAPEFKEFEELLATLGLPPGLAAALVDWVDVDDQPVPGGAEDGYYLTLPQPRRAANKPLVELGDLMNVKGFDSSTIEKLRKSVSVLPASVKTVNVNFAPAAVLKAVFGLSLSDANLIVEQRKIQPFLDKKVFNQILIDKRLPPMTGRVEIQSEYFWVTGTAIVGKSQVETQALLYRGAQPWPTVVWQSVR